MKKSNYARKSPRSSKRSSAVMGYQKGPLAQGAGAQQQSFKHSPNGRGRVGGGRISVRGPTFRQSRNHRVILPTRAGPRLCGLNPGYVLWERGKGRASVPGSKRSASPKGASFLRGTLLARCLDLGKNCYRVCLSVLGPFQSRKYSTFVVRCYSSTRLTTTWYFFVVCVYGGAILKPTAENRLGRFWNRCGTH